MNNKDKSNADIIVMLLLHSIDLSSSTIKILRKFYRNTFIFFIISTFILGIRFGETVKSGGNQGMITYLIVILMEIATLVSFNLVKRRIEQNTASYYKHLLDFMENK